MKKKIAILGSTGTIGKSLINIIKKDKQNFEIVLLTADKNYKELIKQAKFFKVKNIIITNKDSYNYLLKQKINKNLNIYNNFTILNKIFKYKIDYVMSSISGLEGLLPTIEIIKFTKKIAIANKEAIICGWSIIKKKLIKHSTEFIPVDSEHFSIWFALKNQKNTSVKDLYLTASGGPFYNLPLSKFKKVKINDALKHPNWKMGKKISIDSATMMNKVFEVIEAKNIFNTSYNKISILIHPLSYVHAIVKFNNGLIKIIAHDTNMIIPIFNTVYSDPKKVINSKNIDIKKLNNLNFRNLDFRRYPVAKILKSLPHNSSLFETIIVSANDELVKLFLQKKISFIDISSKFLSFIKLNEFNKYKKISPTKIEQILKLNDYVRLKINSKSV
jgi:1-deoxy-D-xylulose-5-phosphate reductoisomerase